MISMRMALLLSWNKLLVKGRPICCAMVHSLVRSAKPLAIGRSGRAWPSSVGEETHTDGKGIAGQHGCGIGNAGEARC
jgi:hypothetical protein